MCANDQLKKQVVEAIDQEQQTLEELALAIHAHPELNFQEFFAVEQATRLLQDWGFAVEVPVADLETAFIATLPGPQAGPTVGLIAEYDAVPEVGHGCGHNLICAGILGAARGLQAVAEHLHGTVQVYGTPAEEGGRAKALMLDAGAFEGLDAALQFHPSSQPGLLAGNLAAQNLTFVFEGKAAHSTGAPWAGINALDAANLLFMNINALRGHVKPDVRLSGYISDGGDTIAIVTDRSEVHYRVRSLDDAYLKPVVERVENCARAAALATGAKLTIEKDSFEPSIRMDETLAQLVVEAGQYLGVDFSTRVHGSGSTDFAYLSRVTPAVLFQVPTWPETVAGHTLEAAAAAAQKPALEGMILGAQATALVALELLTQAGLLE
jgi:amidohydrolase